jgi:phosphinothricin acetyltransferase
MTLIVRRATPKDAEAIARIYAPFVEDNATSFEERAPTADEMRARLQDGWDFVPWLVAERDGDVVGYAYAAPHRKRGAYRWACETSVFVDVTRHRAGAGRALYSTLLELLRLQGFVRAYAGIALPNDASVGLHEALGFTLLGTYDGVGFKDGAWRDVGWWSLALREPAPVPPPARRAPRELEEDAAWRALLPR